MSEMTDVELNKAVAEAAGWHTTNNGFDWRQGNRVCFTHQIPKYATSIDAIAAEEQRAGIRVRVVECEADWMVQACRDGEGDFHIVYDSTEARARCRAFLAAKGIST